MSFRKQSDTLADREAARDEENAIMALVDNQIGHFGRPAHVWFVSQLPKTRSGKMLRRTIQAICEGRDPGDLTTIDDPRVVAANSPGDRRIAVSRISRVRQRVRLSD
ncbi:propionate--CoA ligase [Salmonella enterica subsp. enterica]|nr:propionate--CoA ligase [Salmonella enterica subsp. enterica]